MLDIAAIWSWAVQHGGFAVGCVVLGIWGMLQQRRGDKFQQDMVNALLQHAKDIQEITKENSKTDGVVALALQSVGAEVKNLSAFIMRAVK